MQINNGQTVRFFVAMQRLARKRVTQQTLKHRIGFGEFFFVGTQWV